MNYTFFLIFITCFASIVGSEYNPNDAILQLMRFALLHNPAEENPNPCTWRSGLDTETVITIARLYRVNRAFNRACEHFINEPRNAIIEAHGHDVEIPSLILFNNYGQFCCTALEGGPKYNVILFGTLKNLICIPNTLAARQEATQKQFSIETVEIPYHNRDQKQTLSSFFCIRSVYEPDRCLLLNPDENDCYSIVFSYPSNSPVKPMALKRSVPIVMRKVFEQSQNEQFWKYNYELDDSYNGISFKAITMKRHNKDIKCTVNPLTTFFKDINHTYTIFDKPWFGDDVCRCSTNYIDPKCRKKYEHINAILDEEEDQSLKPIVKVKFAEAHILHDMQHIYSQTNIRLHINPSGTLIIKQHNTDEADHSSDPPKTADPEFNSLQTHAAEAATKWCTYKDLIYVKHLDNQRDCIGYTNKDQFNKAIASFFKEKTTIPLSSAESFEILGKKCFHLDSEAESTGAYVIEDMHSFVINKNTHDADAKDFAAVDIFLISDNNTQAKTIVWRVYNNQDYWISDCTACRDLVDLQEAFNHLFPLSRKDHNALFKIPAALSSEFMNYIRQRTAQNDVTTTSNPSSIQPSSAAIPDQATTSAEQINAAFGKTEQSPFTSLAMVSNLQRYHKDNDLVYFKPNDFFLDRVWHALYPYDYTEDLFNKHPISEFIGVSCGISGIIGLLGSLYAAYKRKNCHIQEYLGIPLLYSVISVMNIENSFTILPKQLRKERAENKKTANVMMRTLNSVPFERIFSGAVYWLLGHTLFNNLTGAFGMAGVPALSLGIHAYILATHPKPICVPFVNLNNSWPARLYRAGWLKRYYSPYSFYQNDWVDE